MALPLAPGLTPSEVAFLCEMELITVIPRQRLESLNLLGGSTPALQPPHRGDIPLWLALLLKRQRRANIVPPPWMHPDALSAILEFETEHSREAFSPPPKLPHISPRRDSEGTSALDVVTSPPFVRSATIDAQPDALPYHWLELGQILLEAAADDFEDADRVQRLLRDLREVRMAKLRAGVKELDAGIGGGGVKMNGVGAMEVAEGRAFIGGVIDGLRKIGATREAARKEVEAEERENGFDSGDGDEEDMDM